MVFVHTVNLITESLNEELTLIPKKLYAGAHLTKNERYT